MQLSKKQLFNTLSPEERIKRIKDLTDEQAEMLLYDWDWNARPNQIVPDGDWVTCLVNAGRGFGKTRIGSEWIKQQVKTFKYCNIMGATFDDAVDIQIKGESGILSVCNKYERPEYKNKQLHWPNGAISLIFSAEEPDRLRGKQHMKLWADELAAWRYQDSWDQAMFGLRIGLKPQALITTTPRPTELIKNIIKDPQTIIMSGTTYDNKDNLAPSFFNKIVSKYEGTRLGRQELNAELLDDNPNALWTSKLIEQHRISAFEEDRITLKNFSFQRIVIGVDPAVTSSENSDFTGIVVCAKGEDGYFYVIEDLTILGKPHEWATQAIKAYYKYSADKIIAEVNNGGDMVESTIRNIDANISYKSVHATRGKILRAEPIAALYEQGKVRHIGTHSLLESQMCNFTGLEKKSPDRLDALVWALTELSENKGFGLLDFAEQQLKAIEDKKIQEKLKGVNNF